MCIFTDSSSDSDTPSLDVLKSPQLQKQVDRRIRDLSHSSNRSGMEKCTKHKSKRGGSVDVTVKTKAAWPHETIFFCFFFGGGGGGGGGANILDETSSSRRNTMVSYMGDLMKDATDLSWQGAKVAHVVLLSEMERGKVDWGDQDRIDQNM